MRGDWQREILAIGLAVLVLCAPTLAFADVLEVRISGAAWIAGGAPVQTTVIPQSSETPTAALPLAETIAPVSAGPAMWRNDVAYLSAKYDLSPSLIEALVWQESRWRPGAVSPVGARGLAQLMPGTARAMGIDASDPRANLEGGARYLRMQLDAFGGDIEKALAAYNAGPGRVVRAGGVPPIRETRNYVAAILGRLTTPVRR